MLKTKKQMPHQIFEFNKVKEILCRYRLGVDLIYIQEGFPKGLVQHSIIN